MDHLPAVRIRTLPSAVPVNRTAVVARRATILSLPACVTSRAKWLGTVETGNSQTFYLSEGLTPLSESEIVAARQRLADIEAIVEPANDDAEDAQKLSMLTELFISKPSAAMTATGAAVRGRSYMMALDDLPAWAIADAIKRWHRGEVDGIPREDLKWAPDTWALRQIASSLLEPYRAADQTIRALLQARPLAETIG